MQKEYIATFFSHFGAIRFQRQFAACFDSMVLMPVPRQISSSCGTCAYFKAAIEIVAETDFASCPEFDQLYVLPVER